MNELMDVKEVAQFLGVSARTVWRLRDCGTMPPPIRLLGAVRWRRRDLLDWIDRGAPNLSAMRRSGKGGGR